MRSLLRAALLAAVIVGGLSVANPPSASADDYWDGYWGWYDGTYSPYYRRYYSSRPYGGRYYNDGYYGRSYYDGYGYNDGYYGGNYYGTSRFGYYDSPWGGGGVQVGPLRFGWR